MGIMSSRTGAWFGQGFSCLPSGLHRASLSLFDARQTRRVSAGPSTNAAADDEDDCMIVEPRHVKKAVAAKAVSAGVLSDANGKRKRAADDSGGPDKRVKKAQTDDDGDVITLD